jgi:hypothetical protein
MIGESFGRFNRGQTWIKGVEMLKPDVLIANVNAHCTLDGDDFTHKVLDRVKRELVTYQEQVHKAGRHFQLVWMTAPPPGCSKERAPIDWKNYSWGGGSMYNYPTTDNRDNAAKKAFEGIVEILDLHPLKSRPDGHIGSNAGPGQQGGDCIHWCVPGPITIVAKLILNMMAQGRLLPVDY